MPLPEHIQEHLETIARHEKSFLESRSFGENIADRIASFAGTLGFVVLHLIIFGVWIVWNSVSIFRTHIDPFPFPLLDTVVALEAILLASFILTRQTSLAKRSDEREHLMLQILLLTEKEVSALVKMNRLLAERVGIKEIAEDQKLEELEQPTPIDEVAQSIQERIHPEL
ncbi:DUF1003 domain-containing protein [Silvibacterium sp.]|uniref:DUF1003 domain-containing protein n=1 Tax=Silvibacterium sp. TaxID=1964179 RepID=UPI0039E573B8